MADILNYMADEAGFTYNLFAVPGPAKMGYLTASGGADWTRWAIDHASRADLLAQWTTATWQRQELGIVWPFRHLSLDHVLVVRVHGAGLSFGNSASGAPIRTWPEFVTAGSGAVCIYGGYPDRSLQPRTGNYIC